MGTNHHPQRTNGLRPGLGLDARSQHENLPQSRLKAELIRCPQQESGFVNTDIFSCLIWRRKAGFLLRRTVRKR